MGRPTVSRFWAPFLRSPSCERRIPPPRWTMTVTPRDAFQMGSKDRRSLEHKLFSMADSQPIMMACSTMSKEHRKETSMLFSRSLCADRKGFIDHLYPSRLTKSTVKVVIMQGSTVMSLYLNDQLKADIERDEKVSKGILSRQEANEEAEEWAEREWKKRWEGFPNRLMVGLAKYHAIIMVMRVYEYIASKLVDDKTLDALTIDTFEKARRTATTTKDRKSLTVEMIKVGWQANLITYLADYSVHQVILMFGYYMYVQNQRKRRMEVKEDSEDSELHGGSLVLSFMKKSTLLALTRGLGVAFTTLGGAIGTMFVPGWGTLVGANLGDSFAYTISDEVISNTAP